MLNLTESKTTSQFPPFCTSVVTSCLQALPAPIVPLSGQDFPLVMGKCCSQSFPHWILPQLSSLKSHSATTLRWIKSAKPEACQRLKFLCFFNTLPLKYSVRKLPSLTFPISCLWLFEECFHSTQTDLFQSANDLVLSGVSGSEIKETKINLNVESKNAVY